MSFEASQTDRLVLRPPEPGDAPHIHRLIGDWAAARMTANVPHPDAPSGADHGTVGDD